MDENQKKPNSIKYMHNWLKMGIYNKNKWQIQVTSCCTGVYPSSWSILHFELIISANWHQNTHHTNYVASKEVGITNHRCINSVFICFQGHGRRCACTSGGGTCGKPLSSWRREKSPIQDAIIVTCSYRGGPSMGATRTQRCAGVGRKGSAGDWRRRR